MKTNTPTVLQFSGYPLRVIEDNVPYTELKSNLRVVISHEQSTVKPGLKVSPADDPSSWDLHWFCSYE